MYKYKYDIYGGIYVISGYIYLYLYFFWSRRLDYATFLWQATKSNYKKSCLTL